jgi:hypothetical protein
MDLTWVSVTSDGHRRFAKAAILTYEAQSKLQQASGLFEKTHVVRFRDYWLPARVSAAPLAEAACE